MRSRRRLPRTLLWHATDAHFNLSIFHCSAHVTVIKCVCVCVCVGRGGTYFLSVSGVDTSLLKPNDSWRQREGDRCQIEFRAKDCINWTKWILCFSVSDYLDLSAELQGCAAWILFLLWKKRWDREREVSQISVSKINHLITGGDDMQAQSSEDSTGKTRPVHKGREKKRSVDCGNSRWCVQQCPHAGKTSSVRFM